MYNLQNTAPLVAIVATVLWEYNCFYSFAVQHVRRALFAIGLLLFFLFGLFCAAVLACMLLVPGAWENLYLRNFYKAASRLCAAMFGKSGRMMLSTEVVFDDNFTWMRKMLDEIDYKGVGHCLKSVYAEGPYSRTSDRELRAK